MPASAWRFSFKAHYSYLWTTNLYTSPLTSAEIRSLGGGINITESGEPVWNKAKGMEFPLTRIKKQLLDAGHLHSFQISALHRRNTQLL